MNVIRSGGTATRGRASALSMLLVMNLALGCTSVVNGSTRPAPGLAPRPLLGKTVQHVLLDGAALSRIFGQPLIPDPDLPPETGSADLLQANVYKPQQCGGVASILGEDTYAGAPVRYVARENWLYSGANPAVIMIHEAVVGFPTIAPADAQFTQVVQQWRRCDGASVTIGDDTDFTLGIGRVDERNSVVSADVDQIGADVVVAEGRAIGVRVNCIVEVEIAYDDQEHRHDPAHHTPSAPDVARSLMDRISAQS